MGVEQGCRSLAKIHAINWSRTRSRPRPQNGNLSRHVVTLVTVVDAQPSIVFFRGTSPACAQTLWVIMFTFGTPLGTPKTMSAETVGGRQTRILINRWSAQRASIPERRPLARIPKLMQSATLKHADLVTQSWVLQLQDSARTKIEDRVARSVLKK
jgi:hypothetical protein